MPQGIGDFAAVLSWVGFVLIIGKLGQFLLAANNIGMQVAHLLFLPGVAVGTAASYMGRFLEVNQPNIARKAVYRTLILGITYMGVLGIPLWFFGESIAQ
ncbi:MATE family efflux transporter [Candidatus Parabeggiatoa sp. HSG14]|uniref:MATE family efflux transporter n=1 Tax=Candidatus Parabeggiatoa sp. HSG14 TaxID=3055593 RepID=UPI0025A87DE2|nr:MATE family efflux transporter [Thiotrichales bacterium HSG14]